MILLKKPDFFAKQGCNSRFMGSFTCCYKIISVKELISSPFGVQKYIRTKV